MFRQLTRTFKKTNFRPVGFGVSQHGARLAIAHQSSSLQANGVPCRSRFFSTESHEFQAKTSKILNIVAQSLYAEKEVFLRELLSNSSDALEKVRLRRGVSGGIRIETNDGYLTISDDGVGMSKEELIDLLGRIGASGTEIAKADGDAVADLIGQFGVGFYAAFMVASRVQVYSRKEGSDETYLWESDGEGSFEVSPVAEGADGYLASHGTRIRMHLREAASDFAKESHVESVLKNYSNFVGFPIELNGRVVNTVKPLWLTAAKDVTDEENAEFYKFIANAYDEPRYTFRYATDAPLSIRSIFYVGETHSEKFGLARMEPGVSLYSRKVLIQRPCPGLLPDWMRFVRGVVDSEDVPLNISRETLQDQTLVRRLSVILTRRLLRFFAEEARTKPENYISFFKEFGSFLKEGICSDQAHKDDLAKLLRFESSKTEAGEVTSLDEYVSRMPASQKAVYYIIAPSRSAAESSPYYEGFRARNAEVLFCYAAIDEFVMNTVGEFNGKRVKSIEAAHDLDAELGEDTMAAKEEGSSAEGDKDASDSSSSPSSSSRGKVARLSEAESTELCNWLKETLEARVSTVRTTDRLVDTPAIVVDHETASFRRMQQLVDPSNVAAIPRQQLEINPKHAIITQLSTLRQSNPAWAATIAEQLLDNALMSAGLLEDVRQIVPRINRILERAMIFNARGPAATSEDAAAASKDLPVQEGDVITK
uniref:Histidine kinase/HSP90-like ATPase domain-containing protein n=1 Tax=Sexangularia sp. CB-2014 TaxID=1486929 RepID=A0A7S1VQP1_9EUKA